MISNIWSLSKRIKSSDKEKLSTAKYLLIIGPLNLNVNIVYSRIQIIDQEVKVNIVYSRICGQNKTSISSSFRQEENFSRRQNWYYKNGDKQHLSTNEKVIINQNELEIGEYSIHIYSGSFIEANISQKTQDFSVVATGGIESGY